MFAQNFESIEAIGIPKLKYSSFRDPTIGKILIDMLPYLFGVAGIILLINIITSGFKMMTSVGDPKVLQAAQAKLTTSLIGILIIFVAFWVVNLIMGFLGVKFFEPILKYG